jgi:membrane protease YdiL (CAAX protease family)
LVETLPDEPVDLPDEEDWEGEVPEDWNDEGAEESEDGADERALGGDGEKGLRARELLLVLFVCFGTSVAISIHDVLVGVRSSYHLTASNALVTIVNAAAAIALLCYVLGRQGRTLRDLGLTAKRADVVPTLLLTAAYYTPYLVASAIYFGLSDAFKVFEMNGFSELGPLQWADLLFNAGKEELIVRAYMMTEVMELTGQVALAVLASTCFQALYHLYQGTFPALLHAGSFLIASLYYAKYRRATPVVLSHFLFAVLR